MEFKYDELVQAINAYNDINRITVEFKFAQQSGKDLFVRILIESQWNLNMYTTVGVTNITHINRITVEFKCPL